MYWNDELVWNDGVKLTHSYTDGEHDKAFTTSYSEWTSSDAERIAKREVTKTCDYCGWTKKNGKLPACTASSTT